MKKRFLAIFMSLVMLGTLTVPTYADDISGSGSVTVSSDSGSDSGDSGSSGLGGSIGKIMDSFKDKVNSGFITVKPSIGSMNGGLSGSDSSIGGSLSGSDSGTTGSDSGTDSGTTGSDSGDSGSEPTKTPVQLDPDKVIDKGDISNGPSDLGGSDDSGDQGEEGSEPTKTPVQLNPDNIISKEEIDNNKVPSLKPPVDKEVIKDAFEEIKNDPNSMINKIINSIKKKNNTAYKDAMAADSLEEIYSALTEAGESKLNSLKSYEIDDIWARVDELDPEGIDPTTEMIVDLLINLPNFEPLAEDMAVFADVTWNGTIKATTLKETQTIALTSGTHWITGTVIINNEAHVTIICEDDATIRRGSELTGPLFNIHDNATLTIKGSSGSEITLRGDADKNYEGNDHSKQDQTMIRCDGDLNLEYVRLINNYSRIARNENQTATDATDDNFAGGAITLCDNNNNVTIKNCTFKDNTAKYGGGIYLCRTGSGTLTIEDTLFDNCDAETSGGAIFFDGNPGEDTKTPSGGYLNYTVNIKNTTIQNCDAIKGCGSAIYMHKKGVADITMTGCTVQNCESTASSGGTIRCDGNSSYKLTVDNCLIQNNKSKDHGGGIYWNALGTGAALVVKNNTRILYNEATSQGGGMFVEGSSMQITDTTIKGNKAVMGGGIGIKTFADNSFTVADGVTGTSFNLTLGEGVVIEENTAESKGGAISYNIVSGVPASGFVFNYTNDGAIIRNNTVTDGVGGGIAIIDDMATGASTFPDRNYTANTFIKSGLLQNNHAANGGAAHITIGNFEMSGGTIENHTVSGNGAGVYMSGGNVTVSGGSIQNNTAKNGAGAYVSGGDITVSGGNIQSNTATNGAGAYVAGGTFSASGGNIMSNNASESGGAAYVTSANGKSGSVTISDSANIQSNEAQNGAGVYVNGGTFTMNNGTITQNAAKANGGAAYVSGGAFTMTDGSITSNTAAANGGAAYVSGGTVTMEKGRINDNSATSGNGGAIYANVASGVAFTMRDGQMNNNEAENGGAVYVQNGNVMIEHGVLNNNKASNNGGAVYLNGNLTMRSGNMEDNTAASNGGAICSTNGTLIIGVEDCPSGNSTSKHTTANHTGKYHPQILDNTAAKSGGGIAIMNSGGKVYFYCGQIYSNDAKYAGSGHNVFMNDGKFYYGGGQLTVGDEENPGLVIIGGAVTVLPESEGSAVAVHYYVGNAGTEQASRIALVEIPEKFNLPDAEYFFGEQSGKVFVGWSENNVLNDGGIRDKKDYLGSGEVVSTANAGSEMHLYAVWVQEWNQITFADSLEYSNFKVETNGYKTVQTSGGTKIDVSAVDDARNHPGFEVVGWYMYQDESQNANWNATNNDNSYEPKYNGTKTLKNLKYEELKYYPVDESGNLKIVVPAMTFGDITLIPKYELAYGDLTVTKSGAEAIDDGQTFIFNVKTGKIAALAHSANSNIDTDLKAEFREILKDVDLDIVTYENGSITIKDLPYGTYKITEDEDWSWRYIVKNGNVKTLTVNAEQNEVSFVNDRTQKYWMDGNAYCQNKFGISIFGNRKNTVKNDD